MTKGHLETGGLFCMVPGAIETGMQYLSAAIKLLDEDHAEKHRGNLDRSGRLGCRQSPFGQIGLQLAFLEHFPNDVAATDKLALDV